MGRLELKLMALLILLTGLPLGVALWRAGVLFERSLGAGLNPLVSQALDDAVQVYGAYVTAEKGRFRAVGEGLAQGHALRVAAEGGQPALDAWLARGLERPGIFGLALVRAGAAPLAAEAAPPPGWLTRTERFPIDDLPGFTGLDVTYGAHAELLARFRSMERDVIEPFRALEADRRGLAGAYAWSFVGYLALAVLLAAVVSVVTARRVTRRLRQLRNAMTAVAGGDLAARVPVSGRDEVADLSQGFNEMATRLAASQARVQYLTQVSVWQGIARKLAHEIKNPLTPILLAAQQAHESYKGEDARHQRVLETAREIVEQEVHVLKRLVENFSRFARLPGVSPKVEDAAGFCRDVFSALGHVDGLTLVAPDEPVRAALDRDLLRQAVTNLIHNAADACTEVERPAAIRLSVQALPEGGALIAVDDSGPGVPEADRERIFDPYVTGKREGTGLGLAIVKKIVLDHGGSITVEESDLGGARFALTLPGSV
ncbi:MAG: HAMP domain-containing protein [Myxococcales bacterium]|nr:HAMP domain-containing protein [Myxococcales bacterium]